MPDVTTADPARPERSPARGPGRSAHGTESQQAFLDVFKHAVAVISGQTELILGAKDLESRHVIATDSYSHLVGLRHGGDVAGRLDKEMPCEGTARFADAYVAEDRAVLARPPCSRPMRVLNVHRYDSGFAALVFSKSQLREPGTDKLLGTVYCAHEVNLAPFLAYLPRDGSEAAVECSAQVVEGSVRLGTVDLLADEFDLCFLLAQGWSSRKIAAFLDHVRPNVEPHRASAVDRERVRICDKLGLGRLGAPGFRDMLVDAGVRNRLPASLVQHLIGSSPIDELPILH